MVHEFLGSTAAEWQAIWAFATFLVATIAATLALVQLRQNGKAMAEQSRPAIVVDFHFRSTLVSIEVKNAGLTAARDVELTWSALPVIAEEKRRQAFRNNLVDGKLPFLAAGRAIQYLVAVFHQYPDSAPRRFVVEAKYKGPDGKRSWSSTSVLDLDQWALALADNDYANKNWNEMQRQTAAQRSSADALKKVADSISALADYVEEKPVMKALREREEAEELAWRSQLDASGPVISPPPGSDAENPDDSPA